MLKFSSSKARGPAECTPNLLPCRIHHDGPVNASTRYWAPANAEDGQPEAYFRGRKLKGKELKVPQGYRGVIVKEAVKDDIAKNAPRQSRQDEEDDEEVEEEAAELHETGSFGEIILWGHESIVEEDDTFAKGMGEWIKFAESMHKPGQRGKQ